MASLGLVQEALLILAGHPSPLLFPCPPHPDLLHPAAAQGLAHLASLAESYRFIDLFANTLIQEASKPIQHSSSSPSAALVRLASSLLAELNLYKNLLVSIETRLLSRHPSVVPPLPQNVPCPPLSAVVAELSEWEPVLDGLTLLLHTVAPNTSPNQQLPSLPQHRWTTTELIELIHHHSHTGSPSLSKVLKRIQHSIEAVWMSGFKAFVVYGDCPTAHALGDGQPVNDLFYLYQPSLATEPSRRESPREFGFKPEALPLFPSLAPKSSVIKPLDQICRALSILHHLNPSFSQGALSHRSIKQISRDKILLPHHLQDELRNLLAGIGGPSHPKFRAAIDSIQELLSNYLFSAYLTPETLLKMVGTLTEIFLLRHSALSTDLVEGFIRLRTERLQIGYGGRMRSLSKGKRGSTITLNDRELDVILLKAGLSTDHSNQDGPSRSLSLEGFSFKLLSSSPSSAGCQHHNARSGPPHKNFSQLLLDERHPALLTFNPPPGLSFLITPKICDSYSLINSCLFTFLITKSKLQSLWVELIQRERLKNRWIRFEYDPFSKKNRFKRLCFENLRKMNWFINIMVDHFWQDVIDPLAGSFMKSLIGGTPLNQDGGNHQGVRAEEEGNNNNDGKLVKRTRCGKLICELHEWFLRNLKIGLGLDSNQLTHDLIDLVEVVQELVQELEGWNFELTPSLLSAPTDPVEGGTDDEGDEERREELIEFRKNRMVEISLAFEKRLKFFSDNLKRFELYSVGAGHGLNKPQQQHDNRHVFGDDVVKSRGTGVEEELGDDDQSDGLAPLGLVGGLRLRRKCVDALILRLEFNLSFD